MAKRSSLTKRKKVGYAFGIFTESLIYNMFYTYYLAFLTEIVGLEPRYGSIVIFISIAWDAITDPLIGNYTDIPGVDKRKVMKGAILPLAFFFILAWTSIGAGIKTQLPKFLLYTFISMCIWLFYTFYSIPYYAVVAELTEDYDERTEIRSLSSLLNAIAVGLGNILPALVPTVMVILGKKYQSNAYAVIAAFISIIAIILGFVCCKSLEGVYQPKPDDGLKHKKISFGDTFKAFGAVLKLKPTRFFLLFVFFFLAGTSMIQSNLTYMVIDCIGVKYDTGIAIVIVCLVAAMAITVPIVEKIAEKKDRRFVMILFLAIAAVCEFLIKIIGFDTKIGKFPVMIVIAPVVLGMALGAFWTVFYPMGYDIVELDEFISGKRRESTLTSLPQFIQKFGGGFGILMAGQFLSIYGYSKAGDTAGKESAIQRITDTKIIGGMENISSLFPAILMCVSLLFLILYPMTRQRFNALTTQLQNKREGKEYSTEGFEKLL